MNYSSGSAHLDYSIKMISTKYTAFYVMLSMDARGKSLICQFFSIDIVK